MISKIKLKTFPNSLSKFSLNTCYMPSTCLSSRVYSQTKQKCPQTAYIPAIKKDRAILTSATLRTLNVNSTKESTSELVP